MNQKVTILPRLLEKYRTEVVPELQKEFGYKNPMQAPRMEKIVVNMGVGIAITDVKILETAAEDLAAIGDGEAVAGAVVADLGVAAAAPGGVAAGEEAADRAEQRFWQGVRQSPTRTTREVRARFRDIDRRLAAVEDYYVSSNPRLSAEIEQLR